MAGIGFELRKIYNEDSLFSKQKAYAYAGIVYTGPMLLGILLTAGVVVTRRNLRLLSLHFMRRVP